MLRLYGTMSEFTDTDRHKDFRKAIFGLCWFHTILIERKKFKSLGWNVIYAFNDSDYDVCNDLLAIYMGRSVDGKEVDENYIKGAPIPWSAIRYLVAQCNYGGRITDERDRRLVQVYAEEIFNDLLIAPERWRPKGTEDLSYVYPFDEGAIKVPDPKAHFVPSLFYEAIDHDFTDEVDPAAGAAAYGQHINAEITS